MNERYTITPVWEYERDGRQYYGVEVSVEGLNRTLYFSKDYCDWSFLTYGDIIDAGAWQLFFDDEPYDEDEYPRDRDASLEMYKFSEEFRADIEAGIEEAEEEFEEEKERQENEE